MKSRTGCNFDVAKIPNTLGNGLQIRVPGQMGLANSKGDYNNDGIDDIIFFAGLDNSPYEAAYIIYGNRNFNQSVIDLNTLTPNIGFGVVFDKLAKSCESSPLIISIDSGFDINHDGIDDLYVSLVCNGKYGYVIYGRTEQFPIQYIYLSDLPQSYYDIISYSAIPVGDVNGDGFKDLLVTGSASTKGASSSNDNCQTQVTYILGQNNSVNLGFETACTVFDNWYIVPTASLGDVNGDGFADIAVSNPYNANNLVHQSGSTYVIYGTKYPESFSINNLTQDQGYMINGYEINQMCGQTLNYIGSINGDELNDISLSCGNGNMFVIYGQKGNNISSISLNTINATSGLFANASSFDIRTIAAFEGIDSFTNQNISSFMYNPGGVVNPYPIIFEGQPQYPFPFDLNSGNYVKIVDSIDQFLYTAANRDIGDVNGDNLTDIAVSVVPSGSMQQSENIYIIFGNSSFFDCD